MPKKDSTTQYLTVRVPESIKDGFWEFCKGVGMKPTAAVNMLIAKCVRTGDIPFDVVSPENADRIKADCSLKTVAFRVNPEVREQFANFCSSVMCVSMSTVVKTFMVQCIDRGELPFTKTGGNEEGGDDKSENVTGNKIVRFL